MSTFTTEDEGLDAEPDYAPNPAQFGVNYGRSTRRFKRMRNEFRTDCEEQRTDRYPHATNNCWLCNEPIDFTLPAIDPYAFELDHSIPRSIRIDLAEDPANFRASHQLCNQARGNRAPDLSIGYDGTDW